MAAANAKPGAEKIGQVIDGRYTVLDVLGRGGFGEVLKVEHNTLKKIQALKLLHRAASQNPKLIKRFEREAHATARLGHENIIDITDFGYDDQYGHYFVMEHLDGLPLDELIKKEGAMPARRVLHIVKQVADALAVVHAEDIIHRDLKPANVFVLQRRRKPDLVKVLDFGIAAMKLGEGEERLTQMGMVLGSPSYMSPEQALGKDLDARSDLYALGIITYQMLAGQVPFQAVSDLMVIRKHLREPPPPLTQIRPDLQVPPAVEKVVMRLLEKSPSSRYQSADELIDVIEQIEATLGAGPARGLSAPAVGGAPAAPARPGPPVQPAQPRRPIPPPPASMDLDEDLDGPRTVLVDDTAQDSGPRRPLPPPTVGKGRSHTIKPSRRPAPGIPSAPGGGSLGGDDDSQEIKTMALSAIPRGGPAGGPAAPPRAAAPPMGSMGGDDDDDDIKTMALTAMPPGGLSGAPPTAQPPQPAPAASPMGTLGGDDDEQEVKTMALSAMPQGGLSGGGAAPAAPAMGTMGGQEDEQEVKTMALSAMPQGGLGGAPSPAGGSLGGGDEQEVKTMALDVNDIPQRQGGFGGAPQTMGGGDEQEVKTMALDVDNLPPRGAAPGYGGAPQSGGYPQPQQPQHQTGQQYQYGMQYVNQPQPGQPPQYGTMEMVRQVHKASSTQKYLLYLLIPALLGVLGVLIYLVTVE